MANFEIFSHDFCKNLVVIDAYNANITTQPEEYARYNHISYYLLLNTWGNLFSEYAPFSLELLTHQLSVRGLLPLIRELSSEADKFIHDGNNLLPFTRELVNELLTDGNWQRILLLLLRFPKRFSPDKADVLRSEAIKDFIQYENRNKLLQRKEYPQYLITLMRQEISQIFSKLRFKPKEIDRYFSSGVCCDADTLYRKVDAIFSYGYAPWGLQFTSKPSSFRTHDMHNSTEPKSAYSTPYSYIKNKCEVTAVPKSFKAARIIAQEEAYRAYENTAVYCEILRHMKSSRFWNQYCIENQNMNRDLCCSASINRNYSTIDLSHASDCVTLSLVKSIFPQSVLSYFDLLPNTAIVDGKERVLQMAATAGCVLTFCIETLVFWSIARTAKVLYETFTCSRVDDVSVYGDDIIVPTEITELTLEILDSLGFIVNLDKTFSGDSYYRETCGAEYLRGYDVASKYFPRKTLQWNGSDTFIQKGPNTNKSLESVIALQHALFEHRRASSFLCSFVRDIIPDFTSSDPADGLGDLWEYFPISKLSPPPYDKDRCELMDIPSEAYRELHYCSVDEPGNGDDRFRDIHNIYQYMCFLRDGRRFDDPLMELLGVSSPTPALGIGTSTTKKKWKKKA